MCNCRSKANRLQRRNARNQSEQLKSLMNDLMSHSGDSGKGAMDELCNAREMAFVITDLESSTAQASTSAAAFGKVQEIHDTVLPPVFRSSRWVVSACLCVPSPVFLSMWAVHG